jgi:dolichyl-phosphate-mannose-protein mannosyltransferase
MKPPQIAIDFGTPPGSPTRTSDDFERVPYPPEHHKSQLAEELPLHYMNEDKARRRAVGRGGVEVDGQKDYYDDDGKDVYAKLRPGKGHLGSGRLRRAPLPPPTTIVRVYTTLFFSY